MNALARLIIHLRAISFGVAPASRGLMRASRLHLLRAWNMSSVRPEFGGTPNFTRGTRVLPGLAITLLLLTLTATAANDTGYGPPISVPHELPKAAVQFKRSLVEIGRASCRERV